MPGQVIKRKGCSTWAIRLYVGKSEDCRSGYKWISGFASKREAEEYQERNAVLPTYGAGRGRAARTVERFRTYAAHWLKAKSQGADKVRPKTLKTYEASLIRARCKAEGTPPHDRFGSDWVTNLARGMVYALDFEKSTTLEDAFREIVLRERG